MKREDANEPGVVKRSLWDVASRWFANQCRPHSFNFPTGRTVKRNLRAILTFSVAGFASILSSCSGGGGDGAPAAATPTALSPCAGGGASTVSGTVNLSWNQVTAANLSGYRVYYGTTPASYFQQAGRGLDAGNITNYAATGLNKGARYYFAVTAYDASGSESIYSNEVCKDVS